MQLQFGIYIFFYPNSFHSLENELAKSEEFVVQPENLVVLKDLFVHNSEHQLSYLLDSMSKIFSSSNRIGKEITSSESQVLLLRKFSMNFSSLILSIQLNPFYRIQTLTLELNYLQLFLLLYPSTKTLLIFFGIKNY